MKTIKQIWKLKPVVASLFHTSELNCNYNINNTGHWPTCSIILEKNRFKFKQNISFRIFLETV